MKAFREALNRNRWTVFAIVAAVLFSRWWTQRDKPERMMEIPPRIVSQIRGFHARQFTLLQMDYGAMMMHMDRSAIHIGVLPLRGGPVRELCRDNNARGSFFLVTDTDFWYLRNQRDPMLTPPGPRARRLFSAFDTPPATLRRVPLDGSPSQDIVRDIPGASLTVVGKTAYWIEPHPDDVTSRIVAEGRVETEWKAGHSVLLTFAPGDASPRPLATGLLSGTALYPGSAGVYGLQIRDTQQSHRDLFYLRASDQKLFHLPNYDGNSAPVEWNGRLYWFKLKQEEYMAPGEEGEPPYPAQRTICGDFMSANQDGSDARALLDMSQSGLDRMGLPTLQVHQGKMYATILSHPQNIEKGGFYRVDPTGTPLFRKLHELPLGTARFGGGYFDSGSFYFIVQEQHENWLDWSAIGLAARPKAFLYRYRLEGER